MLMIQHLFTIKNIQTDIDFLIDEIKSLFQWSNANNMMINSNKSKIMYFKRMSVNLELLPQSIFNIRTCNQLKLLGVHLDPLLTFEEHFNAVLKRASQRLYFLRVLKKTHSKTELWLIYNIMIRSILEYASPLFMSLKKSLVKRIESLQKRAHRIICDANVTV